MNMKLFIRSALFIMTINVCPLTYAVNYDYKEVKDFPPLSSFKSVKEFENNYEKYIQDCLDNTYYGTGGIPCLISQDMWDRELNIYYKQLYAKLNSKDQQTLKQSQMAWLKFRDNNNEFISLLVGKKYTEQGSMYLLRRAGEENSMITPIVKQRALELKMLAKLLK